MSNWYDSDNPSKLARGGSWRLMLLIVAFIVFGLVVYAVLWGLGVVSAPIKGKGDAFKQKESANNRIAAQATFEDLYVDIKATDAKLAPAKQALKADPKSQVKQTQFTGLQNYCLDVVADYNAEARKYLAADFRSTDLPYEIDMQDPSTDCKP